MAELSWLPSGPWEEFISPFLGKGIRAHISWAFDRKSLISALMSICDWIASSETFELCAAAFFMAFVAYKSFLPFLNIIMR